MNTMHFFLGLMGISMLINVEKNARGGGGSTPDPPVNTVAPAVTGTTQVGQTLSTTDGTWTGQATITFTYQWKRDGVSIGGATASTYLLVSADLGAMIECTVTGTNIWSAVPADSNSVGPITSAPGGYVPTYYFLGF